MDNRNHEDLGCMTQALIPYVEAGIPDRFKKERRFSFKQESIVIQQDWTNLGVAGVVWDAAVVLWKYLEKEELNGLNVIELGAGTGILSIAVAKLGATVTATDLEGPLKLIMRNVRGNFDKEDSEKISVKELRWGCNVDQFASNYDLILGADIIYKEEVYDDLISTLRDLSYNRSRIYLSSKIRYEKDWKFFDKLSQYFTVKEVFHDTHKGVHIHMASGNS